MTIKVLIADDEQTFREVLSDVIRREPGLELVGAASDAEEAVRLAKSASPHVALLDVRMPMGGGPRAATGIRLVAPGTFVIALSAEDDASSVVSMLEGGVSTYLAKSSTSQEIVEAIRRGAEQADIGP